MADVHNPRWVHMGHERLKIKNAVVVYWRLMLHWQIIMAMTILSYSELS